MAIHIRERPPVQTHLATTPETLHIFEIMSTTAQTTLATTFGPVPTWLPRRDFVVFVEAVVM